MAENPDVVFRDYNVDGVPSSGDYEPEKALIRKLLKEISGGTAAVGDYRGAWSNLTAYIETDLVTYGGSVWYALAGSTGVTPVEGASWTLFIPGATVADNSLTTAKYQDDSVTDLKLSPAVRTSLAAAAGRVSGENLLTNTNFQLHSNLTGDGGDASTRVNEAGTGLSSGIYVTSHSSNNAQPTFATANTQDMKTGDIFRVWPPTGLFAGTALRVIGLVLNTSFAAQLPWGFVSPTSAPVSVWPVGIISPNGSTIAADGWLKTTGIYYWVDDWAANACPGAKRVAGMRKISGGDEALFWRASAQKLKSFAGTTLTLGAMIYQKVKGAGAGARLIINQASGATRSTSVTVGSWQFVTVTAAIAANTTFLDIGGELPGSNGDIVYFGLPTLKRGSLMLQSDLGQPQNEHIVAKTHWNPPTTVPLTQDFPATAMGTIPGLYGYAGLDIEALSFGQCHDTVQKVNCKIEAQSPTVGLEVFMGAMEGDLIPSVPLTFGPQTHIQVANVIQATSMTWCPLRVGPSNYDSPQGCFVFFTGHSAGVLTQATFDFDDVMG